MRRLGKWQLGMMIGVCVCAWCGTGWGVISSHLTWISIRQGQSFDRPTAPTPGYFFTLRLLTDNTVSSVEFTTPAPANLVCTIPGTTHAWAGNVHTSHKVRSSTSHAWEYQAWFGDIAGLVSYPKGSYQITLYYSGGGSETTTVSYTVPGTSNPIAQPTQKPNITAPVFGASIPGPVVYTWSTCTDPNVSATAGVAVETYDTDDADKLPKHYSKSTTSTASDPCNVEDGFRSAQVMFQQRFTFTNANSIPCEVLKGSATMTEFEVTSCPVWKFRLIGTPAYFWTTSNVEKNILLQSPTVWQFLSYHWRACIGDHMAGLEAVYRFWNSTNNDHFYTTSESERDDLIANYPNYVYEGVGFYAFETQVSGTVPVYRLWHSVNNVHYYTDSVTERNQLLTPPTSWVSEGVGYYVYPYP